MELSKTVNIPGCGLKLSEADETGGSSDVTVEPLKNYDGADEILKNPDEADETLNNY